MTRAVKDRALRERNPSVSAPMDCASIQPQSDQVGLGFLRAGCDCKPWPKRKTHFFLSAVRPLLLFSFWAAWWSR
jgi:hypothetical protein